jgi:hypothetical protein
MNRIKHLAPLKTEPTEDSFTTTHYQHTTAHKRIKSESITDRIQEERSGMDKSNQYKKQDQNPMNRVQ